MPFYQKWDSKGTMSLWRVWAEPIIDSSQSDTFFGLLIKCLRRIINEGSALKLPLKGCQPLRIPF